MSASGHEFIANILVDLNLFQIECALTLQSGRLCARMGLRYCRHAVFHDNVRGSAGLWYLFSRGMVCCILSASLAYEIMSSPKTMG